MIAPRNSTALQPQLPALIQQVVQKTTKGPLYKRQFQDAAGGLGCLKPPFLARAGRAFFLPSLAAHNRIPCSGSHQRMKGDQTSAPKALGDSGRLSRAGRLRSLPFY